MRDAFGGTFLMYMIIIFIVIYVTFLAAALKFVQAYRVKNQIINYIEQYEGFDEDLKNKIEDEGGYLASVSYREGDVITGSVSSNIPESAGEKYCSEDYGYCVTMKYCSGNQAYYKVTTYLSLDLTKAWDNSPLLTLAVSGETRLVRSNNVTCS